VHARMHDQIDFRRTYSGPTTNPVDLEADVMLVIYAERCVQVVPANGL
jgi:hypothetical protein